ncbi:conserved oligomeric Golgi complex subunit 8 [Stigmatopora nigra]
MTTMTTTTAAAADVADVEDESLLASVFQERLPDTWKDKADLAAYLSELSSLGVDELGREQERLAEERARVLEQTRHLAFSDYQTFIRTADCTERIYRDFGRVEANVSRLLDKVPALAHRCRRFAEEAEHMSARRATNTLTLKRHTEILEILEIPQLMDTCVRNAYYEQALELAAYVRRLDNKHGSNPLIQGLAREVRESSGLMLLQIQRQLRGEAQLSSCLRAVGLLRRAAGAGGGGGAPDEAELRVKFLRARGAWLRSALDAVPDGDPYGHASKSAEAARSHLFDVLTQYRAVFSEPGPAPRNARVLRGWLLAKVCELTEALERDLRRGAAARLDSLAPQCMYFGLSFGRVGADFRGRLAALFPPAAGRAFGEAAREAAEGFRRDLAAYAPTAATPTAGVAAPAVPGEGTVAPPAGLLDFPPLARFLNCILAAFNELRLCCPLALARRVTLDLHGALTEVSRELADFHRAEDSAASDGERRLFAAMCRAYARDLLPFLDRCLQILFPASQVALVLGAPAPVAEGLARVDGERLLEPLTFLASEDRWSSDQKDGRLPEKRQPPQ